MTRALPRAHLNSSRLVRFLSENHLADAAPSGDDVGQKLGDWLNFRQAIALHAVLNPEQPSLATAAHVRRTAAVPPEALSRHVQKVRAQLEESIMLGAPPGSGLTRIEMPPAEWDEPMDVKTAFEPYRRFYSAHQRQMESTLQNLRAQVRSQLQKCTAPLQTLAALDAAFENILSERESMLMAKVAKLHEKRFVQALKQHLQKQTLASATATGENGSERVTDHDTSAWLMPMRQALRTALLAELDTRLQPTLGLLEALHAHTPKAP
ncbi:MAG: hypothetical protein RIT44_948 [Pseudomonadota bacterium]|jgi:hypothetical protein